MDQLNFGDKRVYQDSHVAVLFFAPNSGRAGIANVTMDRVKDLELALSFVVHRIEEQAKASGYSLNEEENLLLRNLPPTHVNYPIRVSGPPKLVPRNTNLERLCAIAKAAYRVDRETNPASLDWEFAFAVFTLNHHPMWGVLHSAGVKTHRRPLWDQLLVTVDALVPLIALILLLSHEQTLFRLTGILCVSFAFMLLIYVTSRQVEQWHLENYIERCRLGCRKIS